MRDVNDLAQAAHMFINDEEGEELSIIESFSFDFDPLHAQGRFDCFFDAGALRFSSYVHQGSLSFVHQRMGNIPNLYS